MHDYSVQSDRFQNMSITNQDNECIHHLEMYPCGHL